MQRRRLIRLDLTVEMLFFRLMAFCCAALGAILIAGAVLVGVLQASGGDLGHGWAIAAAFLVTGLALVAVTWVCGHRLARARIAYDQNGRRRPA